MSNTIDQLNITNGLIVEDITVTQVTCDELLCNTGSFENLTASNLHCSNISIDVSQNLNLSGSLSTLAISSNTINCNSMNTQNIIRTLDNQQYAVQSDITTAINQLINGAPSTMDTLNEIQQSLNSDVNFSMSVYNKINGVELKVDTSYNNIIAPHFTQLDTSTNILQNMYNTVTIPRLNTIEASLPNKLENIITTDIGLINKSIHFLNSTGNAISSIFANATEMNFNIVSNLTSGWSFTRDGNAKISIDQHGNINTGAVYNSTGNIATTANMYSNIMYVTQLSLPGSPIINRIMRGNEPAQAFTGSVRIQFNAIYPVGVTPSVVGSISYAGVQFIVSLLIYNISNTGFNYSLTSVNATGSASRFENVCGISWIAIG